MIAVAEVRGVRPLHRFERVGANEDDFGVAIIEVLPFCLAVGRRRLLGVREGADIDQASRLEVVDEQKVLQPHLMETFDDDMIPARNARRTRPRPEATNWGSRPVRSRCKTSESGELFAWSSSRTAAKAAASVAKSPIMLPVSRCQMVYRTVAAYNSMSGDATVARRSGGAP